MRKLDTLYYISSLSKKYESFQRYLKLRQNVRVADHSSGFVASTDTCHLLDNARMFFYPAVHHGTLTFSVCILSSLLWFLRNSEAKRTFKTNCYLKFIFTLPFVLGKSRIKWEFIWTSTYTNKENTYIDRNT